MFSAMLAAVGGFAGYLVLVLLALRIAAATPPAVVVIFAAFAAYMGMAVMVTVVSPPFLFWATSAVYWFLAICFLMVFGAVYKSISLRILAELSMRPGGSDDYQAILGRYVHRESFQGRVRILIADGMATDSGSGLVLTPKGRRIAGPVAALQRLFRIERSG
jgi:hypothetical protein